MGFQIVKLTVEDVTVEILTDLLILGESVGLIATSEQEKEEIVALNGLTNHKILNKTHTFETQLATPDGNFPAKVSLTFEKGSNNKLLSGSITFEKYPHDNMSERQ